MREGEEEYNAMKAQMEESKAEYDKLVELSTTLTKKADIKDNNRAMKMMEADYNFAKTRVEELLALYEEMTS